MSVARDLRLGRYIEADSLVHNMDARAKVFSGAMLFGWIFIFPGWGSFALLAALLAISSRAASLSAGSVVGGLRALSLLWLICFIANLIFSGGGGPLWRDPSWGKVAYGAERGVFLCVRLGLVIGVGSLLSLSTCPTELADAAEWGLRRVPFLGRVASPVALILVLAWTFVPVLIDEARRLRQAQRARGGCWRGGWLGEIAAWRLTFVPLLIGTLRSSGGLALAMEARGFGGGGPRSFYRELRMRRSDFAAVLLCLFGLAGGGFLWVWERAL